ncbi:MAG TPA: dienelactone hydrolase family protein [Isosphaeraceae bacterium]|nr:dienelactone hydrolase family protein [Isosphaeraceae bacterium]
MTSKLAWRRWQGFLAFATCLALGMDAPTPHAIKEEDATFKNKTKDVIVDVFAPEEPGKYPAVVIVHGHGGVGEGKQSGCHEQGRRLARAGYVALVPHYFGPLSPDSKNGRKNARSYNLWVRNVADTVSYAAKRTDVDPKRIGLVSFSLGSAVAISVAARDRRVLAVVENFGTLPEWESLNWSRLPPLLILHGDKDEIVSLDEAYKLDKVLDNANVTHDMHIYEGAGHGFQGEDQSDAYHRTLEFLDQYVNHVGNSRPARAH